MVENTGRSNHLAEIRQGTLRLSSKLKDTKGSVLIFSTNRFPIDPMHLRVGILFILEPGEDRFREFLETSPVHLPFFITDSDELEDLCRNKTEKVLSITNDYILLFGEPPPCIDGIHVKMFLHDRIVSDINESLMHLEKAGPEYILNLEELEKVIKYTFGRTVVSIKDIHRLEGRRIRTQRNHIQRLFIDIPSTRNTVLSSMRLLKGEKLKSMEDGWILITKFRNEVLLPLLYRIDKLSYLRPKLPKADGAIERELGREELFNEILAQNRRIQSSLSMREDPYRDFEELFNMMKRDIIIEDLVPGYENLEEFHVVGEVKDQTQEDGPNGK